MNLLTLVLAVSLPLSRASGDGDPYQDIGSGSYIPDPTISAALSDIYTSAGGDGWTHNHGWSDASGEYCNWHGIQCNISNNQAAVIGL